MHLPKLLINRFALALADLTDEPDAFAGMIRPSADVNFGDYQCNAAMPLGKKRGEPPRDVAAKLVERLQLDDLCDPPEIAGPGFVNLKIKDGYLRSAVAAMANDDRVGVSAQTDPKTVVIDFSSPNVAKPMHVGHIRSTVIGDCLSRVSRFLGENVITDNHLGDWGTQFGIIIYGYKHFGDPEKVDANPVPELAALYRLTNQFIEYHKAKDSLGGLNQKLDDAKSAVQEAIKASEEAEGDGDLTPKEKKKLRKAADSAPRRVKSLENDIEATRDKIAAVDNDPRLAKLAAEHEHVGEAVLKETAKLHQGDQENRHLWEKFLPHCKDEVNRVYKRLNVEFDHVLGESFYHDLLPGVVETLSERGLTQNSDGAVCVFLDEFDSPMIIQKSDGAYLYATTDLATLQYRRDTFDPNEIIYVVDSRQSEHFEKFFAMAEPLGMKDIQLVHVSFGTVLGPDGKPMKTRSGSNVGLESLLDEAVAQAKDVVCNPERLGTMDPPMEAEEQNRIAEVIGIGAIKYADLSHHRTSDYRFDVKKMVAFEGNTATYIQYSYARTQAILRKAQDRSEVENLLQKTLASVTSEQLLLADPAERSLALALLRFEEAIDGARLAYAPNQLCDYLYETAKTYSTFNETCRVIGNDDPVVAQTRLLLVHLTGRILERGLELLGIEVVKRM